jgi:hypothetical protein
MTYDDDDYDGDDDYAPLFVFATGLTLPFQLRVTPNT